MSASRNIVGPTMFANLSPRKIQLNWLFVVLLFIEMKLKKKLCFPWSLEAISSNSSFKFSLPFHFIYRLFSAFIGHFKSILCQFWNWKWWKFNVRFSWKVFDSELQSKNLQLIDKFWILVMFCSLTVFTCSNYTFYFPFRSLPVVN